MLLARIYEVFPLRCSKWGGAMHIIAFITDRHSWAGAFARMKPAKLPHEFADELRRIAAYRVSFAVTLRSRLPLSNFNHVRRSCNAQIVHVGHVCLATDFTVFCDVAGADRTVTLPAAASNGGRIYYIRRVGGGNNQCNVTPVQGGNFVLDNGAVARGIIVQSDGATWWVIAQTFQ